MNTNSLPVNNMRYNLPMFDIKHWYESELDAVGHLAAMKEGTLRRRYATKVVSGMQHLMDAIQERVANSQNSDKRMDLTRMAERIARAREHVKASYGIEDNNLSYGWNLGPVENAGAAVPAMGAAAGAVAGAAGATILDSLTDEQVEGVEQELNEFLANRELNTSLEETLSEEAATEIVDNYLENFNTGPPTSTTYPSTATTATLPATATTMTNNMASTLGTNATAMTTTGTVNTGRTLASTATSASPAATEPSFFNTLFGAAPAPAPSNNQTGGRRHKKQRTHRKGRKGQKKHRKTGKRKH